jgi:hypothetical protein
MARTSCFSLKGSTSLYTKVSPIQADRELLFSLAGATWPGAVGLTARQEEANIRYLRLRCRPCRAHDQFIHVEAVLW